MPPTQTNAERLARATQALNAITDTPRLDAEILLAHALGISRASLLARLNERPDALAFDALLERRAASEPIAYILGEWEFFSLSFQVRRPLLVPRPETEHLVEAVLDFVGHSPANILEIGVGTGCVSVSIARNAAESRVVGTDISEIALETAAENCRRHGVEERVTLLRGDLFDALHAQPGGRGSRRAETCIMEPGQAGASPSWLPEESTPFQFDVICSNPPYVEEGEWEALPDVIRLYEDPGALLAGADGLDVIRRLAGSSQQFLRPGGLLAIEIGMGQRDAVEAILAASGYGGIRFCPDLAGIPRITLAERSPA